MTSRFSFSRYVRDIDTSAISPHSNCSNQSTPQQSKQNNNSTPTSVSPHNPTSVYKPPQLKILLPDNNNNNININNNRKYKNCSFLKVPSDSEKDSSSPLLSEPSPNPASPLALNSLSTLNSVITVDTSIHSKTSPDFQPLSSLSINTRYSSQSQQNQSFSYSSYPVNQSPVSTTSTADNLTPLYTAHILESSTNHLPDFCLAPLDLVVSPTPTDSKLYSLQILNETPTHCNKHKQSKTRNNYLIQENRNYNYLSDSDYDFHIDLNSNNTFNSYLNDIELETNLIKMGCCCSDPLNENNKSPQTLHKAKTSSHDITMPIDLNIDDNDKPLQIEITHHDNKKKRKQSFTDKYFRSKAQVDANNNKQKQKQKQKQNGSPKNGTTSPHKNGSTQHSMDDDIQPIPKDAILRQTSNAYQTSNGNLSLLDPRTERSDNTETRTYNTFEEQKDVVSPIPTLDKIHSITNAKRPSTSALSSPLHSVRLSITPKGHLAPIHIMDHSSLSDSDKEDNSISTTDSKEDKEYTKYSEINTPVDFLKKHQTITKFVSSQQSQTSDKNVLSRRKRRHGVSDNRHTLTFSKPPIPQHELPQSPKFTEYPLDVTKPIDFLHKMLEKNLLFTGVDAEFAEKMVTKVVDLMRAADFEIDEVLMHQGAEGDAFYAVESGNFDILVSNDQGDERKVADAKRGDCVGEYALLYNQPRTATLKATETSRVWGITAEQFAEMRQEIMDWNVERFEKRQEFIHSIPLFQKLEQHELLNMTHACHAEIYDINDYIIKPGLAAKKNTNVYIIMEGTIIISYDDNNNNKPLLGDNDDDDIISIPNTSHKQLHSINLTHSDDTIVVQHDDDEQDDDDEQIFQHPINNQTDPPICLLPDFDDENNTDNDNNNNNMNGGLTLNLRSIETQSINKAQPLSLSALNSVNSVQSVHSVNIIGCNNNNNINLDMGIVGGDKELGPSDYFARNLFVNQYDDEFEEEIISARAHTRCKVLKIARDDFVLIMASQQNLFADNGVVGDGELPDNKTWNNKLSDIALCDLEEKDVLGIGSFGRVTLVEHRENGQTFALKSVSKYRVVRTGQEEHIINEKRVLTMLDSPFCVKLFGTFKTETTIYFLTEVVLGGELFTVLRYNEKFDKNATRFYAGCVILALEHLHSMDIIYRDLKPENLLLNDRGYLQLTDFGFAKKRNTTCTLCGTPQYLAPEVIHNWVQSFATDWWALGVLLYEMVVGHPPFEDDENIKMYEKILVHEPAFPKEINSKLRHLIQKLLEKNAYQRLGSGAGGARQVKQHPFFKNKLNWIDLLEQKLDPPYKPCIDNNFDTSNFDHFSDYEESSDDEEYTDLDLNSHHFKWVDLF